jgi:hypothetical protein
VFQNLFRKFNSAPQPIHNPRNIQYLNNSGEIVTRPESQTQISVLTDPKKINQFINRSKSYGVTSSDSQIKDSKRIKYTSIGDVHIFPASEPNIHLESGASVCTQCVTLDKDGNMIVLHIPAYEILFSPLRRESPFYTYKDISEHAFSHDSSTFVLGMPIQTEHIKNDTLVKIQSHLGDTTILEQAIEEGSETNGFHGFTFIPKSLATNNQNNILLMPSFKDVARNNRYVQELHNVVAE